MKKIYKSAKKLCLLLPLALLLLANSSSAQPWLFNFGTGTGTANNTNAGSGLTTFYTATISPTTTTPTGGGTYRVRIGTGGGSLTNPNPGTSLGTGSEATLNAGTAASTNKFGVYDWTTPTNFAYLKTKFRTTSSGNGTLNFSLGVNTLITDNNNYVFHYNNSLTSFTLTYAAGAISTIVRRNAGANTTITGSGFAKDTDQDFEVYANNNASSTTYYRAGTTYTLNSQSWDLWVGGTQISSAGGWAKAGTLAAGVDLSGFGFFAESSTSNAASIFLDDFEYSNALPCTPPTTQASAITFSSVATTSMNVNWTNGNGAGRVIIMNNANSFTTPTDGTNPTASLAYSGSGEQVIYNNTGSGPISVTGLTNGTTYYYRVYEYCSATRTYQTATAANNPNSQTTTTGFTFDGNLNEALWGTQFADSIGGPTTGFGVNFGLNALYCFGDATDLYFGIAGRHNSAGDAVIMFIDSKAGGYTDGNFGRTGAPGGIANFNSGTTFDAGFTADYCVSITSNGSGVYTYNVFTLAGTAGGGGGSNTVLGAGTFGTNAITAGGLTKGFEFKIAKSAIGYTANQELQCFTTIISNSGFLSNLFLSRAAPANGNFGSGAITFGSATPDPVTINTKTIVTGNSNAGTTWNLGTASPTNVNITVQAGHTLTINASESVNNATIAATGAMAFSGTNTLTIAASKTLANSGTFTGGSGKLIFAGLGTTTGTLTTNDVDISNGVTFSSNTTIGGILTINNGGYVNTGGSPKYGTSSTLKYNTGVAGYGRNLEWNSNAALSNGCPQNVLIANSGTSLNLGANSGTALNLLANGNLTVDAGCGFYMDYSGNNMTVPLTINGNVTVAGGLSLSGASGGDIKVGGNFTLNTGATFSHNTRAVFFNGAGTQDIGGTLAAPFLFDYVVLQKTTGTVRLLKSVTIEGSAGGNALTLTNATDYFDINGNTLILGKTGVTSGISGNGYVRGSTTSNLGILGSGTFGTINFDPTTPGTTNVLGAFTQNRTGSGTITLGQNLFINTTYTLTSGLLVLGSNNFRLIGSLVGTPSVTNMVIADGSGEFQKTYTATGSFTFPIGDDDAPDGVQYSPATLNFTAGTFSSAYVGVRVSDIKNTNIDATVDFISRFWSVSSSGITTPTYNFTGVYTAADINGTEANSDGGRWNGSSWTVGTACASNSFAVNGLTTLPATNEFGAGDPLKFAEINIKQSATNYLTGSTYAFGNVNWGSNSDVVFTIENLGLQNLTMTAATVTGTGFSLQTNYTSPVIGGANTTFTIRLTPNAIGAFSGNISIPNNDATGSENPYVINFTGTGVANNISDVSFNSGSSASTNTNIAYATYQATTIANTGTGVNGSIGVMGFYVRDGGSTLTDADNVGTELTAISFTVSNVSNLRRAALFNGTTFIAEVAATASPIVFTGLSGVNVTAADNTQLALNLRVSFASTVTDNQQVQFTVSSVSANASSSTFGAANGGAAQSSVTGDINRIEVTADRLAFVQQPTTSAISAAMTPSVTVKGTDVNANTDLDYTGSINITSSGTLTGTPVNGVASAGIATYSTLTHTVLGTSLTLTATTTGLAFSNTATSTTFDITSVPANSYRTIGGGTWTSGGGTATWQRLIAGTWTANAAPAFNSANNIYIRHSVSITGSTSAASVIIENGGTLTNSSPCTYGGTICRVETGGVLQVNASITISGDFIVQDGGTVNINFAFGTPASSIWNGTEYFGAASNLVIQDWDFASDFLIPDNTSISTNTYNGYTAVFGNIKFDFGPNQSASDDWILLAGGVTVNMAHGDLWFLSNSTNGADIRLSTTGNVTSGIGGNFLVDDLYTGVNNINLKSSGNLTFTIKGNYIQDASTVRVLSGSVASSTSVLNVEGDMTITPSAVLDFNSTVAGGSPAPLATINLKGDLTGTSSGLLQNSNTSSMGVFNFTGTGDGLTAATTQTIDIASTSASENRNINFNILSGAYVRLINRDFELGNASGVYVQDGGVFDFGFNGTTPLNVAISGAQTGTIFQSLQGSTLKITSVDGISTTGAIGNVRTVASNRSFNQTAVFNYIGKANQVTGNGITSGSTGKIVICELDLNTLTLTPSNNIAMSNGVTITALGGRLDIRKGIIIETSSATITGTGRLVMTDGTFRTSILATTLPQLSNYSNYSLTGGTVELNGNGAQTISGAPTGGYFNLAITNAGTKSVTSGFTIANNLSISDGIFDPANNNITGNAGITMTGGRFRMSALNQTLPQLTGISTAYALSGGTIELYGSSSSQTHSLRGTFGAGPTNISYFNIDLNSTGANVSLGSQNVNMQAGFSLQGTMTVASPTCFQLASGFIIADAGTSTFALAAGATLKYGGSIASSGASGNIRTDTRTFPISASYGFTGTVSPQATGNALPATMVNMYMDKTASSNLVTLPANTGVTGNLNLGIGKLDLNNFNLTLGTTSTNATITGGSATSYVVTDVGAANGTIIHKVNTAANTNYFFPVGDVTNYTPITLNLYSATLASATLQGSVRDAAHPNLGTAPNYLTRYWTLDQTGISSYGYGITADFIGADNVGSAAATYPYKRTPGSGTGTGWIGAGGSDATYTMGTGSIAGTTITWNGLYSFSDITGSGGGTPQPITLLNFDATPSNDIVKLNWSTASEINNDYFEIQHSKNAKDWELVAKQKGAGNHNGILSYDAIDETPYNGTSYYRLKQVDYDGKYDYSEIKVVTITKQISGLSVKLYPNPTNGNDVNVVINNLQKNTRISIEIKDLLGNNISTLANEIANGNKTLTLATSNFAEGAYFITFIIDGNHTTHKLIVTK